MSYQFIMPPIPRVLRREDRAAIEAQIEALIDLLDREDGDPDLEAEEDFGIEDTAHDPHENLFPIYAIDQTLGPINEVEATQQWMRGRQW